MSEHSYPMASLIGDYARSAVGVVLTAVPLAITWFDVVITPALAVLVLVFAGYGLRTGIRQRQKVVIDDRAIAVVSKSNGRQQRKAAWSDLQQVRLAVIARRRGDPLMELTLRFGGDRFRIDSQIGDFRIIARRAFTAATGAGLELRARTRRNFAALGMIDDRQRNDAKGGDGPPARRSWGRPADWLAPPGERNEPKD